jgi:hypothetical protein
MRMEPAEFAAVPLHTSEQHACSPEEPPLDWRGVTIRAPTRVSFKREERAGPDASFAIPICGYLLLDAELHGSDSPMTLVAVESRSGRRYAGAMLEQDPSPEVPPPDDYEPLPDEAYADLASGGYFNANLSDYVTLPVESAEYRVHIELRNHRSNVVTIELVLEP